jgi:hypothetical protein
MSRLIDLAVAKNHVRITHTHDDEDLELKLLQAEAIVLAYIARPSDADWTAMLEAWTTDTVPMPVSAAILLMFAELYRDRGDEDPNLRQRSSQELGDVPMDVSYILKVTGYRTLTLA